MLRATAVAVRGCWEQQARPLGGAESDNLDRGDTEKDELEGNLMLRATAIAAG